MRSLTTNMITSIFLNNIYKIKSRIFLTFFHFKTIKDTLCISTNFKDTGLPTHPCIRNILRFWQFVKKKSWFSFSFCLSRLSSRPVIPFKKRCLVSKLWYVILWNYFTGSPSCFFIVENPLHVDKASFLSPFSYKQSLQYLVHVG